MINKTTYVIPAWFNNIYANNVKSQLKNQGVDEKFIIITQNRQSRSLTLNKCIKNINTPYVGILDDDVIISNNSISILENLLDKYHNIGMALAATCQMTQLSEPIPNKPVDATDIDSLQETSSKMWSLNFTLLRKSCNLIFDEDYFGSQMLDFDAGLELLKNGYSSVIDHRAAVAHKQTSYETKNLMYHAVVARSRQIFMLKWKDRDNWVNAAHYNSNNNNTIPTIEELTHANDKWLFDYISKYDAHGLVDCWYNSRFCKEENFKNFIEDFEKSYVGKDTQIFKPYLENLGSMVKFK